MPTKVWQDLEVLQVEKEVQFSSEGEHIGSFIVSSSLVEIYLMLSTFQNHRASNENYLDFLLDKWICIHAVYFAALKRKNKKMCNYVD